MRIAFFTENEFTGKVNRANAGRTDTSWMVALNADHHPLSLVVQQKYDLGIIIVPKKNPTAAFTFFKHFTHLCEKWGTMQEANQTYWQNGTLHEQFGYLNFLDACDVIFCHNERDAKYFRGLFPGKKVEVMQSVLIEDALPTNITDSSNRTGAMIGGNWTEWYSGQDSYFIAQEFNEQIYAPSMGRKHHNEDDLEEINYLPYLNWTQWIEELSKRKYAVHLMRTYAAGTFSLNCAYLGVPCIGWNFMDTQKICFPELSFEEGDMESARKAAIHLRDNKAFYDHCSTYAKEMYAQVFREDKFLDRFNSYF